MKEAYTLLLAEGGGYSSEVLDLESPAEAMELARGALAAAEKGSPEWVVEPDFVVLTAKPNGGMLPAIGDGVERMYVVVHALRGELDTAEAVRKSERAEGVVGVIQRTYRKVPGRA